MITAITKKIEPNSQQFECIKTLSGSVMVLAGPGTGKTFTIIERIKYMLEQDIEPESILCLTFSEAAANEMKIRLVREIGAKASAVGINTYHAFCNELISQYPSKFELLEGISIIDDISKYNLMKDTIEEFKPVFHKTKWGDYNYYIKSLIGSVDEVKKNRVTKKNYFEFIEQDNSWQPKLNELYLKKAEQEELLKQGKRNCFKTTSNDIENLEKKIGKAKEVWEIYEIYSKKLKQNNFIDFNDMINFVLEVFETDTEFLEKIRSNYKYFLVDEYQDTNFSQNSLIFAIAGSNPNLFVVGDDDQIIYGFQGAQTDNLEKFLKLYPNTKVICLNENNRSTQAILDFSHELISRDTLRLENNLQFKNYGISKKLVAKNQDILKFEKKVQFHIFEENLQENNFIVDKIEELAGSKNVANNINLSQIAILTKTNAELETFANLLKAKNILFQINKTRSIFEIKPSILIYFYLRTLENPRLYGNSLFAICAAMPFEFEPEDYTYIMGIQKLQHSDFISIIKDNIDLNDWKNKEKINKFIKDYDALRELKSHLNVRDLIITIINKTNLLEYYVNSEINRLENISSIKKFVDEAASFTKLYTASGIADFIDHLNTAYLEEIPISIDKDDYVQNAVQLISLHSSKGREFEYVFIPNLTAKNWEKKRTPNKTDLPIKTSSFSEDEELALKSEQLRLMFVGFTRAKHSLFLSYSNITDGKTTEITKHIIEAVENENLTEKHIHTLNGQIFTEEIFKSLQNFEFNYKKSFENQLRARIKDIILSPTSLNTYMNCPRLFLYSEIYKIPYIEKESENANYGSAVHKTLQWATTACLSKGFYPTESEFIDKFLCNLNSQKFETLEQREIFGQRGKNFLPSYYKHFIQTDIRKIKGTELRLDCVPVEKYLIKGFIDRVEHNSDDTYFLLDYKTGAARPKSQIEDGKNYENYLNQLRMYKFAYESLYQGHVVSKTGLIFVEEPEKNVYIDMTEKDNEIIKEKILKTYEGIHKLDFHAIDAENQNKDTCKFCQHKMICKLNVI
ncbi:MAG: ATP-dependent DNA helicase [Candidatus Gastranaerophilaceae bacterium]|jgi:DNA helicase-2/ATP-dependent DNA helicase PcrA